MVLRGLKFTRKSRAVDRYALSCKSIAVIFSLFLHFLMSDHCFIHKSKEGIATIVHFHTLQHSFWNFSSIWHWFVAYVCLLCELRGLLQAKGKFFGHSLLVFIPFASCCAAHCDAQCVVELFSQCALHMCIIQQHMSECTHFPRCAIVIFTTSVNEHNVNM